MKLFHKLMAAMLAGAFAVGIMTGCRAGGNVNDPVPTSPRPDDPAVEAVYEMVEAKAEKLMFTSAPAYSKELSALAQVYLENGDKTAGFAALKETLAAQGMRVSNAQDTAEVTSVGSLKYSGPSAVWTDELGTTDYSLDKSYTDTMIAGLVDYRCNSVGIAVKDGQMVLIYARITSLPAETT